MQFLFLRYLFFLSNIYLILQSVPFNDEFPQNFHERIIKGCLSNGKFFSKRKKKRNKLIYQYRRFDHHHNLLFLVHTFYNQMPRIFLGKYLLYTFGIAYLSSWRSFQAHNDLKKNSLMHMWDDLLMNSINMIPPLPSAPGLITLYLSR